MAPALIRAFVGAVSLAISRRTAILVQCGLFGCCLGCNALKPNLACGWLLMARAGQTPPTWVLADRLIGQGCAGVIVPSFAPGADQGDRNLVLWDWAKDPPHCVAIHDPSGRLPRDQLSWR